MMGNILLYFNTSFLITIMHYNWLSIKVYLSKSWLLSIKIIVILPLWCGRSLQTLILFLYLVFLFCFDTLCGALLYLCLLLWLEVVFCIVVVSHFLYRLRIQRSNDDFTLLSSMWLVKAFSSSIPPLSSQKYTEIDCQLKCSYWSLDCQIFLINVMTGWFTIAIFVGLKANKFLWKISLIS